MKEKHNFKNCFWDLTGNKSYKVPNINFKNVYQKIYHSQVIDIDLSLKTDWLILEIININNCDNKKQYLKKLTKCSSLKRIVLTYQIKQYSTLNIKKECYQIIDQLKELKFDNVAIDFYIDNLKKPILEYIIEFLAHFSHIKHFSIYFLNENNDGIYVQETILNYKRYNVHMWSLPGYESTFHLSTLVEKNYLGLGKNAISRDGLNFYKLVGQEDKWKLQKLESISKDFVIFHDHIERLNFYTKISEKELKKDYLKLCPIVYKKLLAKYENNIMLVHEIIIGELFNRDLKNKK